MFKRTSPCKRLGAASLAVLSAALLAPALAQTDLSTVPLPTYSAASTTDIKPNIFFVLDDSGSMSWTYLPDWANTGPPNYTTNNPPDWMFRNSAFNGQFYNPAIRYLPPLRFTSGGTLDTTTYPSMTGTSAATGANTSQTLPNWRAVKRDAYGVQSSSVDDLTNAVTYYTAIPGEFCTSPALTSCTTSTTSTGSYQYPAPLRWCNSDSLSSCRALFDATYQYPRMPAPRLSTLTISSASNLVISGLTVDSNQIMSAATASSSTTSTVATAVANAINACKNSLPATTNCTTVGYSATASGNVVYILAPGTTSSTPTISRSGTGTVSVTAFARSTIPFPYLLWSGSGSTGTVPGENLFTTVTSTINSYPYPGSTAKDPARTDCAGTTCTYAEEMTNYANWYTYYRTRMQMMKTAVSRAFANLDSSDDIANSRTRFRVGYMSINNNTGSDFANITDFSPSQKITWFSKLFAANPNNSTPLRQALSTAGSLYAGKYNGQTLNGSTVTDPLQYSCQRNFTILSTDGYWNGNSGFKLDGSTAVGNQDGLLPRPYYDGASTQIQTRTSTLQQSTSTQMAQRGTLQSRTAPLQTRTGQQQTRTRTSFFASWSAWINTVSCTPSTNVQCQVSWGSWSNTSNTCTVSGPSLTGGYVDCQYGAWGSWSNASSCSPAQSTSPTYTLTTATDCQYSFAASAATQTCLPAYTAGDFSNVTVYNNCTTSPGTWSNVSSCTVTTPGSNGNFTACQYSAWTSWSNVSSCTAVAQSAGPTTFTVGTARDCQTIVSSGGTSDTLADVAAYYFNTDLRSPTATGADQTGTCTGPIISPSTTPNDLCANNVPIDTSSRNTNNKQHMVTHTLGLGAQGYMVFSPYQNDSSGNRAYFSDYWSQPSGDFYSVKNGSVPNATSGICPWQTSGNCNWPTPASDSQANIDDLWHAAVNGLGTYFSARDPSSLADALRTVLTAIDRTPRPGAAAAAASSNPNVTSSDNYVFSSSYMSLDWYGELIMQQINTDGSLTDQQWSAMRMLECATNLWAASTTYQAGAVFRQGSSCYLVNTTFTSGTTFDASAAQISSFSTSAPTSRTIYTAFNGSLVNFNYSTMDASQQAYFNSGNISTLSQLCTTGTVCLSSTQATSAAGANLVNYLRGDRTNEGSLYRTRKRVLGDIVSSEARYIKQPQFRYTDAGYSDFKTAQANRAGVVYVGANDGMLHAVNVTDGSERWAFVPPSILPNLYKLADINYSTQHQFYVDGTPEIGDICPTAPSTACTGTTWKTILVGGLGLGGKTFYALDITNPSSPVFLWEFSNANMGYSYGNPRITKQADGTWVVIVATGYNNSDGIGRVFVLNASTGALIRTISTGVGTSTNPSGLNRLSARASDPNVNNTVTAVYGGDLLGNVWRFDINGNIGATGYDAQRMIQLYDPSGNAQPITERPVLASINSKPVIIVGTGRYLGTSDINNTQIQSVYAFKYDDSSTATLTTPRNTGSNFVAQSVVTTTCPSGTPTNICSSGQAARTVTANPMNWGTMNGWYMDLPSGEMSFTDPTLALGTLVFTTVNPSSSDTTVSSCTRSTLPNAQSYLYYMDYTTGGALANTNGVVGVTLGGGVATRPSIFRNQDGSVKALIRISGATGSGTDLGTTTQRDIPVGGGSGGTAGRRSWRILNGDN